MIAFILSIIPGQALAAISAAIAAILGLLVYGGSQRRKGAVGARKSAAEKAAKESNATLERVQHATGGSIDADTARRLLAERDTGQ